MTDKRLENGARIRAAVHAYVNTSDKLEHTIKEMLTSDVIKQAMTEAGIHDAGFAFHVRSMYRNGELKGRRDGRSLYFSKGKGMGRKERSDKGAKRGSRSDLAVKPATDTVVPPHDRVREQQPPQFGQMELVDVEVGGVMLSMAPGTHLYVAKIHGRNRVVIG